MPNVSVTLSSNKIDSLTLKLKHFVTHHKNVLGKSEQRNILGHRLLSTQMKLVFKVSLLVSYLSSNLNKSLLNTILPYELKVFS